MFKRIRGRKEGKERLVFFWVTGEVGRFCLGLCVGYDLDYGFRLIFMVNMRYVYFLILFYLGNDFRDLIFEENY